MHPYYHRSGSLQRSPESNAFEHHPERLVLSAMTDWRFANATLTSAVNNLVEDDEVTASNAAEPSAASDDVVCARWTAERQRAADDDLHLRELSNELGVPLMRLGLHNRDEHHPMFAVPTASSRIRTTPHDRAAPRPWLSIERLVANRIERDAAAAARPQHVDGHNQRASVDSAAGEKQLLLRLLPERQRSRSPQLEHETVFIPLQGQEEDL
jgi:hypothetical protein